jgi:hypothetical protein
MRHSQRDSLRRQVLEDLPISALAGLAGTKAMEPVGQKLYEWEPEEDRRREEAVRPGPPFEIAAAKTLRLLGRGSDEKTTERLGLAFHYGLAVGWAPTYALLRRRTTLRPLTAGLASGTAMWLLADEGMTPALGFSAPNRAYPLSTHIRALLAHLAFGAAVAGVTETAWRLLGRNPN